MEKEKKPNPFAKGGKANPKGKDKKKMCPKCGKDMKNCKCK